MHGLLSITLRPLTVQGALRCGAVRYLTRCTAPLRCKIEIGKEAKMLVEKAARKDDPFVAENNDSAWSYPKHHAGFHGFELYPLQLQVLAWAIILVLIGYYASAKIEVIIDRSYKNAPFTWATMSDREGDYVAFSYDPQPAMPRLDIMEVMQREMIEEARRRGTRI